MAFYDVLKYPISFSVEAIGCFRDKRPRALPYLVKNLRGTIDWHHMDRTIAGCAEAVQAKGDRVGIMFSIVFFPAFIT